MAKGPNAFRTISEAADELGVPQHVLRFWETKFSFIRPMKRAGGRRFYRPQDIAVLRGVRALLHDEGFTIKGVQKLHKEQGVRRLASVGEGGEVPTPAAGEALIEPVMSGGAGVGARDRLAITLGDLTDIKARLDQLLRRD